MSWSVVFNPSSLPPKSLKGLKSLSISHDQDGILIYTPASFSLEQFGDSPNLQTLRLFMKIPAPESLSGIPWSYLKHLSLDTTDRYAYSSESEEIGLAWRNFFESRAITDLSCLQELTVKSQSDLLGVFLTANFPWHQLTTLHLHIRGAMSNKDLALLACPLRLSTNLVRLEINLKDAGEPMLHHQEEHPMTFPLLQHLSIRGPIQLSMFGSFVSSKNLRSFEARLAISLSDFYFIVQQCTVLTDLTALVTPSTHPSASSGLIILSYLHTLRISFNRKVKEWSPASFPTLLVLPRLTSLTVQVSDYDTFPFDFSLDLINRSNCQLSKARFLLDDPSSLDYPEPIETVLPLLAVINNADTVHAKGFIFPQVVLDSIAAGTLLPCLFHLELTASTLDQLLSTINFRLRREKTRGYIKLQKIGGYIAGYLQYDTEEDSEEEEEWLQTLLETASEKIMRKWGIAWESLYKLEKCRRASEDVEAETLLQFHLLLKSNFASRNLLIVDLILAQNPHPDPSTFLKCRTQTVVSKRTMLYKGDHKEVADFGLQPAWGRTNTIHVKIFFKKKGFKSHIDGSIDAVTGRELVSVGVIKPSAALVITDEKPTNDG
ncbi:hypothetical protein H0H93_006274 [Arthromyces matolae]|nr:hypothetical protein H0H93_006274 [Arthromyces matolae]